MSMNAVVRREEVIRVEGLRKSYGTHIVLDGIDLQIYRGQRIVVCGPSGSGKSTFIRCINGLESFEAGHVKLIDHNGTVLEKLADIRREVGMVFQSFNLFPHLSILENCTIAPMEVRGTSRKEAEARAMHYLEKVKVADQAHKFPGQLSGGQQQRVAIARALCMTPSVMLFDEPTSALDPEVVQEVLETMVNLASDGMTMICVTHEMGFAQEIADRVVFIDRGQIIEDSPPALFFGEQQNERVKSFLGRLNRAPSQAPANPISA
jgi:ABC-type polar amino acid transport system ATPase subunit